MLHNDRILLTTDQVEEWKREEMELLQVIEAAQQKLAVIKKRLEAAAIFMDGDPKQRAPESPKEEAMTEAVPRILEEYPDGLTRAELKRHLLLAGFAKERLGNYFYTVLNRLKERGRIVFREDKVVLGLSDVSVNP